jgi:hypothetical protein
MTEFRSVYGEPIVPRSLATAGSFRPRSPGFDAVLTPWPDRRGKETARHGTTEEYSDELRRRVVDEVIGRSLRAARFSLPGTESQKAFDLLDSRPHWRWC